jgi:hypothetical protein
VVAYGWQAQHLQYENELYAERLRREAQAEALATGAAEWTDQLDTTVRVKLGLAWDDVTHDLGANEQEFLEAFIEGRTLRSIGWKLRPEAMRTSSEANTNERLLSLIEAEHEALTSLAQSQGFGSGYSSGQFGVSLADLPDEFQHDVNRVLEGHIVAFHLHHNDHAPRCKMARISRTRHPIRKPGRSRLLPKAVQIGCWTSHFEL